MVTFQTSRTFDATPQAVFAAFAAPERLANWWGPDGFRNTFAVFDFRPDGQWEFTMHGPDGTDYPNVSRFTLVERDRQVVLKHLNEPHFQLTVTLESVDEGTLVAWEQVFDSAEFATSVRHIIEPANEQNLNRWQAEVVAGAAMEC